MGVGHGFWVVKVFEATGEQRGFRVHFLQYFSDVRTIDVRHKVHIQVIFVRTQRFGHHKRTEVGATDTDVHHIRNRFAGVAFPAAGDNRFREGFHLLQHRIHFRHHIFAVHDDRGIATVAQRHMQHCTIFRTVDLLTGEHGLDSTAQVGLFCQVLQFRQRFFGDAVLEKSTSIKSSNVAENLAKRSLSFANKSAIVTSFISSKCFCSACQAEVCVGLMFFISNTLLILRIVTEIDCNASHRKV